MSLVWIDTNAVPAQVDLAGAPHRITVGGYNAQGRRISETVEVPRDGTTVTTRQAFYGAGGRR